MKASKIKSLLKSSNLQDRLIGIDFLKKASLKTLLWIFRERTPYSMTEYYTIKSSKAGLFYYNYHEIEQGVILVNEETLHFIPGEDADIVATNWGWKKYEH